MIKADLITGFLGSGKTTFLKQYANFLLSRDIRPGILINDHGAVNVDVMLMQELEKKGCIIESVAGACDRDCHMRRFKTKLIALAMYGCDRVIIEPSGLFDTDEFFDSLREEPLERMYEAGSVITIADAGLPQQLSPLSEYLLASQCANAGRIILSKAQLYPSAKSENTVSRIKLALEKTGADSNIDSRLYIPPDIIIDNADMEKIMNCGWRKSDFVKKYRDTAGFDSLYFMNTGLSTNEILQKTDILFTNRDFGSVFRVKGFIPEDNKWYELNAAQNTTEIKEAASGQEIVIVIGEQLNKEKIKNLFGGNNNA